MTTMKTGDRAARTAPEAKPSTAGPADPADVLGSETRRLSSASTASSRRAYERRIRRRQKMSDDRLVRPGRVVSTTALNRAPFVVGLIALLGLGVTAVLWLNTLTDEAGMRTSTAKSKTTDLRLTIEQLRHDVAMLDATPRIADQAKALGMVQAGDSAMLVVDGSGNGTVVGEPTYVPAPAPAATPSAQTSPAPAAAPADAAPTPSPAPAEQPAAPPAAEQPAAEQPAAEQPAAEQPAAAQPAPQPSAGVQVQGSIGAIPQGAGG